MAVKQACIDLSGDPGDAIGWWESDGTPRSCPPGQIATQMGRRAPIAVLPGERVALMSAEAPRTSRRNLARALPFLLEERLAEPVEGLHFALGDGTPQGSWTVAVTAMAPLARTLERWRAAGIQPRALHCLTLLLPWTPGTWTLVWNGPQVLLRLDRQRGLALDPPNVDFVLERALAEGTAPPGRVRIYHFTPEEPAFPALEGAGVAIEHRHCAGDLMTLIAREGEPDGSIDLLQGPLGFQGRWGEVLRPLRVTALLGLLWLAVLVFQGVLENRRLETQLAQVEQRIAQVFRTAFPDARMVRPGVQMQQNLTRLRRAAGGGDSFLVLMARAGGVIQQLPGTAVDRIRYQDGILDLFLRVPELRQLNKLKQDLHDSAGLTADIQSAVKGADGVQGHLRVRTE
ncbi:MAG: hypothetical protein HQL82_12980 [Magnetococcales bacterium]|nr:hypothetical protein [Magnetococcales bacterium]